MTRLWLDGRTKHPGQSGVTPGGARTEDDVLEQSLPPAGRRTSENEASGLVGATVIRRKQPNWYLN